MRELGIRSIVLAAFALAAVSSIFMLQYAVVPAYANNSVAPNVILSLTVPASCEISLVQSISFGVVLAGSNTVTTSQNVLDLNNGNGGAFVAVSGGNWMGANALDTFGVSNTVWSSSNSVLFKSANALTLIPANTNIAVGAASGATIWFGLGIPPGQTADTYTQNILVTNLC